MLISIISVNYNDAKGLENTIKSVQKQTYTNYEHIIIDGNSNDGSKKVIEKFKESFSYWVSETDSGIYNAMNKGIEKAKGDYLLFLNSGDYLLNELVLKNVGEQIQGGLDIYYGNLNFIDKNGIAKTREYPKKLSFYYFFDNGHLPHPASFTKKALFDKVGVYKEKYKIVADWDFYVNAICRYNATCKHLDLIITNFDTHGISSKKEFTELRISERNDSLRENFSMFLDENIKLREFKKTIYPRQLSIIKKINENRYSKKIQMLFLFLIAKIFNINNRI
jgi:glycosyltransferase involved in cell wall biosynthesis